MEEAYEKALAALADCLRLGDPPLHYGTLEGTANYRAHAMAAHCHRMLHEPEEEAEELLLALAAGGSRELQDRLAECLSGLGEEARVRLEGRLQALSPDPAPVITGEVSTLRP